MGGTWITDLTDLLDSHGQIPDWSPSSRIAAHFAAIVTAATGSPSATLRETPVRCRRRPNRKPCPGKIQAGFEPGTGAIHWSCPVCQDQGWLSKWQGTQWDQGGRVGLPRIDRVVYRHGLTDDIETEEGLEEIVLEGPAVTEDIVRSIHDNELLGTSGFYGDPTVGDPLQVDHLEISHDGACTKITVYNRGIMLFGTDEPYFVQVHRVCCKIARR